ncbi:hypothetical protein CQW23_23836 [Capsicum baccatum]|uniref:Uncharacterized protein n=1 Tax=Capsicum baccatum TaxID=33114 RepID=A0A2G2VT47_CAPBA|nr:hypothetical protein CQW23_23836 [Capsicum baccatum]
MERHGKEVIWDMWGAETTEQGDYSAVSGRPQCFKKDLMIVDLLPGVSYNIQTVNCCKGGVLTSMTQDPKRYGASFEMGIGSASDDGSNPRIPKNFTLGIPRYTYGQLFLVPPSKFSVDKGRQKTKVVADKFAAAAAGRNPVCNLALIVGTTDIPDWCYFEAFGSEAKSNFKAAT